MHIVIYSLVTMNQEKKKIKRVNELRYTTLVETDVEFPESKGHRTNNKCQTPTKHFKIINQIRRRIIFLFVFLMSDRLIIVIQHPRGPTGSGGNGTTQD